MSPAGKNDAGFTLIELMVAMLLLGMVTAVVFPSIAALGRRNIDDVAISVVNRLREARIDAMRSGVPREIDDADLAMLVPADMELEGMEEGGIVLLPNGASSGAELVIRSKNEQRHVLVDWLTGRIGFGNG
ncbi:MAG: type II secretion system protein [Geminicoccaceae bacterium]|nr:type II secretion system protein [Geminicoccaceae bacterium]